MVRVNSSFCFALSGPAGLIYIGLPQTVGKLVHEAVKGYFGRLGTPNPSNDELLDEVVWGRANRVAWSTRRSPLCVRGARRSTNSFRAVEEQVGKARPRAAKQGFYSPRRNAE